ncbi:MAG TPA: FixG Ig-like domain-containing protein, partial [Anaerolineales bacterium]|nr:FixG Ig-like domain-containing protein [Anaerolineales bacterium]
AVVDLYANSATSIFYDDFSLVGVAPPSPCDTPGDIPWASVSPSSGTTPGGSSSVVDVDLDSTGLSAGDYTGNLCVNSNDPVTPLVTVPVTLTVTGGGPPVIDVSPDSMSSTQAPDSVVTDTLTVGNLGGADLAWSLFEDNGAAPPAYNPPQAATTSPASLADSATANPSGTSQGGSNAAPDAIILDQQPNQSNGIFADVGCDLCGGPQVLADNFALSSTESIGEIVLWSGYFPGDVPIDPDTITVIFHQDSAGLPGTAVYTENDVAYSRVQTGVILFGVHEWMHTLTLASPVTLSPGNYWVEIYNDTGFGTDDFFWEVGNPDTVGNGLPGSAFAFTAPGSGWNFDPVADFAIQLVTVTPGGCSTPSDIPWVSVNPLTGSTPGGGSDEVSVIFDSTGLTVGSTYTGTLCVTSNDATTPEVTVPLTLTVVTPTYGVEVSGDQALSGDVGTTITYTVLVTNTGNVADVYDLEVSGNVWNTTLSSPTVVVNPGQSEAVMVFVDVPAGATSGEMDHATFTATSQGDPSQSDSADLMSTAVAPETHLYLPLINKES